MATGTIKKVVSDRGFGFIAAEDGKEYFFHRDGLDRSLEFDRLVGGARHHGLEHRLQPRRGGVVDDEQPGHRREGWRAAT